MIATDLCKVNYQTLLITYLKFLKKCPKCMGKKQIKLECDFIGLENKRLFCRCKECKNKCYESINGLIKNFPRIYQFCNSDLNEFILLLRKGVYPYKYMDSLERFD